MAPMSSCLALFTQAGISRAEPGSLERTTSTPPTGSTLTPRISSIKGPGQKLPRASISLSTVYPTCCDIFIRSFQSPVGMSALDEERDLALFGTLDEGSNTGDVVNDGLEVIEFHVKQFHGHT